MHGKQTFLDATSCGKFCFEITHNARVHVNFSFDFTTTLQSVDSISSEIFAATTKKKDEEIMDATSHGKYYVYYTKNSTFSLPGMTETICEWKTQNPKACNAAWHSSSFSLEIWTWKTK